MFHLSSTGEEIPTADTYSKIQKLPENYLLAATLDISSVWGFFHPPFFFSFSSFPTPQKKTEQK